MIGERLAEVRKDHNDTQAELAAQLNVSVSAVRSWEQEKSSPPHELLVTICKLYHVSSDYLLGLTSEDPTDSNQKTGQFSNIELEELQNFKNYLLWKRRN